MALQQAHVQSSLSRVQSYRELLHYFYPEVITSFILYFMVQLLDGYFVSQIQHTAAYATLGITNTLFHFITKLAEGVCVGVVVICGRYNGLKDYKQVGQAAIDAFWATCAIGGAIALAIYYSAPTIYELYGVSEDMITLGVPFMRLRAWSIFFTFISFALIGFLRAIKNTQASMYIFLAGSAIFLFFDYVLIFGACGFSCMAFQGSALASVIQYGSMALLTLLYILFSKDNRIYGVKLFTSIDFKHVKHLIMLSFPVMVDKASLAICTMWAAKCIGALPVIAGTKTTIISSYTALKHIERFILLPALAFAQILTFIVSNGFKVSSIEVVAQSVKRILLLSAISVAILLIFASLKPNILLYYMDPENKFSEFVIKSLPFLAIIIGFDVLQLLFSAILRGAGFVQVVMWTRVIISLGVYLPLTILPFNFLPDSIFVKFILIILAITIANAVMSLIYWFKIKKIYQKFS